MKPTIIIAEAGVNHNGNLQMALQLVDAAAQAGVDYVKFQTFKAEKLVTKNAQQANYQKKNIGDAQSEDSQFAMLKRLELSESDHAAIIEHCKLRGVKFLSTAFDLDSMDFLASLKPELWKVPSGEVTNYPYLRKIAQYSQPVVLSTGMCSMDDVKNAIDALTKNGLSRDKITVLHCNTEYPTPMHDVNLRAMLTIAQECGVEVGYSDHTLGIEVPIAAVAMGATVIEKHFTLSRELPGPDHKASLEPAELKAMVSAIRNVEKALGTGIKQPSPSEQKNIAIARKSIVAATHIKAGELFNESNLTVKRPGNGISPMLWDKVIGTTATRDYQPDELISPQ